jgi:hypothetical protein
MELNAGRHGVRERLVKLCGMLSSEFDGERAVAASKAATLLRQAGLRWDDIVVVPAPDASVRATARAGTPLSDLRADLACCGRYRAWLTDDEGDYVDRLVRLAKHGRSYFRGADRARLSAIARRLRRLVARQDVG